MLSRLISLLSRIPAVKWAFNRLRPSPQGGSIVMPIAASESLPIVVDIADASPADAGVSVAAAVAENDAVIMESPAAAPADINVSDASPLQRQTELEAFAAGDVSVSPAALENKSVDVPDLIRHDYPADLPGNPEPVAAVAAVLPVEVTGGAIDAPEFICNDPLTDVPASTAHVVAEEQAPNLSAEAEPAEAAEVVIRSGPSPELLASAEHVVAEETQVASPEIDIAPAITFDLIGHEARPANVVAGEPPSGAVAEAEAISAAGVPTAVLEIESAAADIPDIVADDPSPSVAADLEPASEEAPSPAIADEVATASSEPSASPEPALMAAASPPKPNRTPRTPTRAVDPADRTTLIRQRWAQTGIRMWNPRLHGTGEATLNIQGRIELLPPEPGETMPRYDRLEFKMLGGQIVCEGVIVEGPAHGSQRSFTRLAEPVKSTREPIRERQAALA